MRKVVMVAAIVALLASTVVVLWSQAPTGPTVGGVRGQGMGQFRMQSAMSVLTPPFVLMMPTGQEQLNLTEDQKAKLTATLDKYQKAQTAATPKIQAASKALREGLVDPNCDENKLKTLIAEAKKADAPTEAAQLELWMQVRTILTADQLKTLQQLNVRPGGGRGGGGGGGTTPVPTPAQ